MAKSNKSKPTLQEKQASWQKIVFSVIAIIVILSMFIAMLK